MIKDLFGEKGKYEIVRLLGSGGMCDVYEAKAVLEKPGDDTLRRSVRYALKHLKTQDNQKAGSKIKALFENEMHVLESIGEIDGVPELIDKGDNFYVMELVEGKSLQKESLSGKAAIKLEIQLCDILGSLHGLTTPVVHLDIKPSNLMRTEDGRLYLVDYGLASFLSGYETKCEMHRMNLEKEDSDKQPMYGKALRKEGLDKHPMAEKTSEKGSSLAGTKAYAAPEQYGGMFVTDKRTDIFQFGKTLQKIINRDETDPFLYRELMEISERCSPVKKQQRYTDIQKVKSDLMLCERNARRSKNRFVMKLVAAAALFIIALALIIFSFMRLINPFIVAAAVIPGHLLWNDEGLSEELAMVMDYAKIKLIKFLPFKGCAENGGNCARDGIFLDIVKTADSLDF